MASEGFQYRALFEYKKEREDDISLQPGDTLIVNKVSVLTADYQDGDEKVPKGWLQGTNERTKEKGDFPGTFVEYVGLVRMAPPVTKPWLRPVPPTPGAVAGAEQNQCLVAACSRGLRRSLHPDATSAPLYRTGLCRLQDWSQMPESSIALHSQGFAVPPLSVSK
ncbi:phosphatidylinositol 3-kinase regulatory subunit alpha-like [Brienomyrus brachyistius]|uniref:phosphatidylinositol 3-kinase regulatory subunit alpha-like n=1 Tax=Brienomyrus brachyistius TaxID=42636 RepID=UPI0020B30538|nr:phosphatidylinositol 3-kinase regulatory subunit alpha-like [Brienomyrus brachyistius]